MHKELLMDLIFLLAWSLNAFGYETNVHEEITKNAIVTSNIEQYMNEKLNSSLISVFDGRSAAKWIELGSNWEDENFTMRWLNHFYDPTTGKGLNKNGISIGQSSLQWGKYSSNNAWDWGRARDYYYLGLTNTNTIDRDKALAAVFRSLGQIIHLMEDKAVPAHVRNDAHNYSKKQLDMYEAYTRDARCL